MADAIAAIESHLKRGGLDDGLVFDAVRVRLIEIGESVKALPESLTASEPAIDWRAIARSRDQLTQHYWDTAHAVVEHVVVHQLGELPDAVRRLQSENE